MRSAYREKKNTCKAKRRGSSGSLRFRLTISFISFSLLLMAVIWTLEMGFLEQFYRQSMKKKASIGVNLVGTAYSSPQVLDMDTFGTQMMDVARDSDLYFSLRAVDNSFSLSSNDKMSFGHFFMGSSKMVDDAIEMLGKSGGSSLDYVIHVRPGDDMLVSVKLITSPYRSSVYLVAVSPLTPLGPAVNILSSLLKLITVIALGLGALFAFMFSKTLSRPVTALNNKAQELAEGNYNVQFDGSGYAEIEELAGTLTTAAKELAKSDNLQKDLLANISHDLRTPLTMIKSYAELIRDISGDRKERRDEHLQVIIEETDRLSDLVGDILALSKLQAGTEELDMETVDIQRSAESILNVYKVLEEQDGFELRFLQVPGNIYVRGDERRLQQVISNLISNAVRYSGDSKKIEIGFERENGRILFFVQDHGIGIAEKDQALIWNRYQKASRQGTRAYGNSTGLGLSIAREILERHNAQYGVESRLGEGSRFWFSLPIAEKYIDTANAL